MGRRRQKARGAGFECDRGGLTVADDPLTRYLDDQPAEEVVSMARAELHTLVGLPSSPTTHRTVVGKRLEPRTAV